MPHRSVPIRYVVCLSNADFAASLEPRKLYRGIPNVAAEKHDMIRVVDESGENYVYPNHLFGSVALRTCDCCRAATKHAIGLQRAGTALIGVSNSD